MTLTPGTRVRLADAWLDVYPKESRAAMAKSRGVVTEIVTHSRMTLARVRWDLYNAVAAIEADRLTPDEETPMSDTATDATETATPVQPILRRTTRLLPVPLTDLEMRGRALEQASVYRELGRHADHADSVKAELKATERRLEARLSEIAEMVSRGTEMRDVEIEIRADYDAGLAREIRLDTGEELHTRKLEEKERQIPLLVEETAEAIARAAESGETVALPDIVDPETGEVTRASVSVDPPTDPDPPVNGAEATQRARRKRK